MTKKELMNLGLTEEQADGVLDMLKDSYIPLYRFNEINDKMKSYKSQFEAEVETRKSLESKVKDTEKLDAEISRLKADNEKATTDHANELAGIRKSNAVMNKVRDSKAKNAKAVMALLDMDKITYENDELSGIDEQLKSLQESDDSKFLFEGATGFVPKGTEPGQNSGGTASNGTVSFSDAIKNYFNK